jgi:hypothetical protein
MAVAVSICVELLARLHHRLRPRGVPPRVQQRHQAGHLHPEGRWVRRAERRRLLLNHRLHRRLELMDPVAVRRPPARPARERALGGFVRARAGLRDGGLRCSAVP